MPVKGEQENSDENINDEQNKYVVAVDQSNDMNAEQILEKNIFTQLAKDIENVEMKRGLKMIGLNTIGPRLIMQEELIIV